MNSIEPTEQDIKKWVKALRSGIYKQCQDTLCEVTHGQPTFCCLGVATKVFNPNINLTGTNYHMPSDILELPQSWLTEIDRQFENKTEISLVTLNDSGIRASWHNFMLNSDTTLYSFTFDEIADLLEAVYIHKVLQ